MLQLVGYNVTVSGPLRAPDYQLQRGPHQDSWHRKAREDRDRGSGDDGQSAAHVHQGRFQTSVKRRPRTEK